MTTKSKVKSQKSKITDDIRVRINRIKGQLDGVQKMMAQNRPCLEIIQQIQAARSAMTKLETIILSNEVCHKSLAKKENFSYIMEKLLKNI